MDIIHSFISDILLDYITTGNLHIGAHPVTTHKNFYDIDTYLTWAERRLERLAQQHLTLISTAGASLDDYFNMLQKMRTDAATLYEIRGHLQVIFPFIQRMTNAEFVVLKYIYMLETLYDTIKSERLEALPKRPREEPADSDNEVAAAPQTLNDGAEETKSSSEEKFPKSEEEEPKSYSEEEFPEKETFKPEEENVAESELEEEVKSVKSEEEPASSSKCKELGIVVKRGNRAELIKQYEEGTIDPKRLTRAGLRAYMKRRWPTVKTNVRMTRETLLDLIPAA